MRKTFLVGLLIVALGMPALAGAEVKAGAGNITLLGHIDYVYRSSQKSSPDWYGYESNNVEFAVLGVAGQVGDNLDWVITEAFVFAAPNASVQTAVAASTPAPAPPGVTNTAMLLDARINWHLSEGLTLSFGRFIPPTSMTWNPHLLKVMGTINYPLINGSGLQPLFSGKAAFVPLPLYQGGVMLTWKGGAATLMLGSFNGTEIVGGPEVGGVAPLGLMNVMDIDKTKGTVVKLCLDGENSHIGAWYYGETASLPKGLTSRSPTQTMDAEIVQWGLELAVRTESLILQAQYLSTTVDPLDYGQDNLIQNGWYVLVGGNLGDQAQWLVRYDYFNYDQDAVLANDRKNEESATTLGVNYMINPNATLGINYTWRYIESVSANTNELAVILEMNLF